MPVMPMTIEALKQGGAPRTPPVHPPCTGRADETAGPADCLAGAGRLRDGRIAPRMEALR